MSVAHKIKTKNKSGKKRFKQQSSVADQLRKTLDHFKQRFTFTNPMFVKRYIKSELHFLVFFSIRSIDEQFFTYFQWGEWSGFSNKQGKRMRGEGFPKKLSGKGPRQRPDIETSKSGADSNQQAMFVDVI